METLGIRTARDDALPPASNQRMFPPNVRHVVGVLTTTPGALNQSSKRRAASD